MSLLKLDQWSNFKQSLGLLLCFSDRNLISKLPSELSFEMIPLIRQTSCVIHQYQQVPIRVLLLFAQLHHNLNNTITFKLGLLSVHSIFCPWSGWETLPWSIPSFSKIYLYPLFDLYWCIYLLISNFLTPHDLWLLASPDDH